MTTTTSSAITYRPTPGVPQIQPGGLTERVRSLLSTCVRMGIANGDTGMHHGPLGPSLVWPEQITQMWMRVGQLSDGTRALAHETAWEIATDYRRAAVGDTSVLALFDTGWTLKRVMAACLRDADKVAAS